MRYRLHEAITRVLAERQDAGLTAAEITQIIRERDWYRQKDGTPLTIQQTHARIRNYKHLFHVDRSSPPAIVRLQSKRGRLPIPIGSLKAAGPPIDSKAENRGAGSSDVPLGLDPSEEWFWEGNVQRRLVDFFASDGWTIEQQADTSARSQGVDVLAIKGGQVLVAEVKGYPSVLYARGLKRGQVKRTRPPVQARHWFAGALHAGLKYRAVKPTVKVVLAFPDFPTYRKLVMEAMPSLRQAGLHVYFIAEDGSVNTEVI
jgi:hypothetical protein